MGDKARTRDELADHLDQQIEEIKSPFNLWVTGEEVGHEPTISEAAIHYIKCGGASDFARRRQSSQPSLSSGSP